MRFVCMGCLDESAWEAMSEEERQQWMDECMAYDDVLRKGGHFLGGEALQGASQAVTLRWQNGRAAVIDGPFVESKEQIGGLLFL